MRQIGKKKPERIIELGKKLFDVDSLEETIERFELLFSELGSPIRAAEAGIGAEKSEEILDLMRKHRVSGMHHGLTEEDREQIVKMIMA